MITTRELAALAVAATSDDPDGTALAAGEIFRLLDTQGSRNTHLQNRLNHPRQGYIRKRISPLNGSEEVKGDFLALSYCPHDPFVRLDDFADVAELEQYILSDSGILNPFIANVVAFVRGKVAPYEISFSLEGATKRFDKYKRDLPPGTSLERHYANRSLVWRNGT